jgi:hypothetical protein
MTEATAQPINAVRLVGTIGAFAEKLNMVQILTKAVSKGREYTESHAVKLPEDFDTSLIVEGNKLDIFGTLDQHKKRTIVQATEAKKVPKNASFVNVAKVVGPTARAYEYFAPSAGKRAFGNLLVRMGEMFARVVVFNHKARSFSNGACPQGSEVEAVGRIHYRSNQQVDPATGETRVLQMTEIIADPDQTRLLKAAELDDPFKGTAAERKAPEADNQTKSDGIPF